jgi:hypothetical protein
VTGIELPGEDRLPSGGLRDLVTALHSLYRGAGRPGLRVISKAVTDGDFRDTVSHEKVSAMLHGQNLPKWSKLECVVRQLAKWHTPRLDPDQEAARFLVLWQAASGGGQERSQSAEDWALERDGRNVSPTGGDTAAPSSAASQQQPNQITPAEEGHSVTVLLAENQQDSRTWSSADQASERLPDQEEIRRVYYNADDVALLSLLDLIECIPSPDIGVAAGAQIIADLAMGCLDIGYDDQVTYYMSYLLRKEPGAHVCCIGIEHAGDPLQAYILKLSLNKRMLEREYEANLSAARVLGEQALVRIIGRVRSNASGYHAIAGRVPRDVTTLANWLLWRADKVEAAYVAEDLLGEVLQPLFNQDDHHRVSLHNWITPSTIEAKRAWAALERYAPAISDSRAGRHAETDYKQLRSLIGAGNLPIDINYAVPTEAVFVRSFGDLYSTNVIVQAGINPRPILMDASLFGWRHWAADSARLLADTFLRLRRPGVESMIWDNLEDLVRSGLRLCPYQDAESTTSAEPVDEFISRCVRGLQSYTCAHELGISADDWHWQWHMALAKEFLDESSHDDLTPPRGALAVMLASHHLQQSIALLKSFTEGGDSSCNLLRMF